MTEDSSFKCTVCTAKFMTGEDLVQHSPLHSRDFEESSQDRDSRSCGSEKVQCEQCGDWLESMGLRRHQEQVHSRVARPKFECSQCPAILFDEKDLMIHKRLHGTNVPLVDDAEPKSKDQRKPHSDLEEPSNWGHFICLHCGKVLRSKSALVFHERSHEMEDASEKLHHCEICGKDFKQKAHLDFHLWIQREGHNYPCDTCNASFQSQKDLLAHCQTHLDNLPFQCQLCDRTFAHRLAYLRHEQTHEGESSDSFGCISCQVNCHSKEELLAHFVRDHE